MSAKILEHRQYAALLTKQETGLLLGGVSVSFINQLLAKKKLPKVRLSYRVTRIPRKAVEEFIAARTTAQRGATA
jgi:excisionase family DNA binding protein